MRRRGDRSRGRQAVSTWAALILPALALVSAPATSPGDRSGESVSGVWRVQVRAATAGGGLLCQLVPELRESYLDTVTGARDLEELVRAVIPDSLLAAYEGLCRTASAAGDIRISCLLPMVLAPPCSLTVAFSVTGKRVAADSVAARGAGMATLHGPGACPEVTCPGEIHLTLTRLR